MLWLLLLQFWKDIQSSNADLFPIVSRKKVQEALAGLKLFFSTDDNFSENLPNGFHGIIKLSEILYSDIGI